MRYVGIAAYSGTPPEHLRVAAEEFIHLLSACARSRWGIVVVVGGYWGLMRHVVDAALSEGLKVVILPPLEMEDVRFPEGAVVVRTGTSFRVRSVFLVRTSEVLVAMGGASGTMQEVVTAYTEGVPVVVLRSGLPSDRLESLAPYLDDRKTSLITYVDTPEELANQVCRLLGEVGHGG